MKRDRGVIYFASSASYAAEAAFSARTLREHSMLPVVLVSGGHPLFLRSARKDFDETLYTRHDEHPLKTKVRALLMSPFERTLFLDTDTVIRAPVDAIFSKLEYCDLLLAHEVHADWNAPGYPFLGLVDERYFNTGVVGYRLSDPVRGLFAEWLDRVSAEDDGGMRPGRNCDQQHFNRMLADDGLRRHGVTLEIVPNRVYNVRPQMVQPLTESGAISEARILHYRGIPGQPRADWRKRAVTRPLRLVRRLLNRLLPHAAGHLGSDPGFQGPQSDTPHVPGGEQ